MFGAESYPGTVAMERAWQRTERGLEALKWTPLSESLSHLAQGLLYYVAKRRCGVRLGEGICRHVAAYRGTHHRDLQCRHALRMQPTHRRSTPVAGDKPCVRRPVPAGNGTQVISRPPARGA